MSASSKKKLRKEQNAAVMTEKQLQEQKEAKNLKRYTMTFIISMVLIVALVIGIVLYTPINRSLDKKAVALTVGDYELNTPMLTYYLVDEIQRYYADLEETYGEMAFIYAGMFGLDVSKSLDDQMHPDEKDKTWGEVFIDYAIESATKVYALNDAAQKAGHKMTEAEGQNLANEINTLEYMAKYYYQYESTDSYLRACYGTSATTETYIEYLTAKAMAVSYTEAHFDSLEYTDKDFRDREKKDYYLYSSYNFSGYDIPAQNYYTGGTKDDKGNVTYSDAEKAAALAAAKKDAEALVNGKFEDSKAFDKAIAALEINKDSKTAASTLYENQFGGESVADKDLREWLSDKDRKAGDMGMFPQTIKDADGKEEVTGYHVVMFHEGTDNTMKLVNVRHILLKVNSTTAPDGTKDFVESAKLKAEKEAKEILATFENGKFLTGASFGMLAEKHSDDGSASNGGLLEEVYPGQTVTAFNDWCFDEDRKVGDTGIILSDYGYHVMYFEGFCDMTYRDLLIDGELRNEATEKWANEIIENADVVVGDVSRLDTDRTIGG